MSPMAYWAYCADLYDYIMQSAVLVDVLLALLAVMVWTQNQVGFVVEMATDYISVLSHYVLNTAWEQALAPSELGMY